MLSQDHIRNLKNCTVAIGVMQKGTVIPTAVFGSGFVVDSEGYIATASHVLNSCEKFCEEFTKKNHIETRPAIFSFREADDGTTNVLYSAIDKKAYLKLQTPDGIISLDVVVVNLLAKGDNLSFLKISTKKKPDILSDIIMTGYPSGNTTLNIAGGLLDTRFFPLIHKGKITGLIPSDSVPRPQLIQTDIITTGGSSGSPLIDPTDGTVLGISQKVISGNLRAKIEYEDSVFTLSSKNAEDDQDKAEPQLTEKVLTKSSNVYGYAVVGPVIGLSNNMIQSIPQIVSEMKKGNTNVTNLKLEFSFLKSIQFLKESKKEDVTTENRSNNIP